MWYSAKYMAFDFETSGTLEEYALQPWRIATGDTWATSLATVRREHKALQIGGGLCVGAGVGALPPEQHILAMLQQAIDEQLTLVAWNALFDISVMIGYGFQDMVFQCKFLDAMLLWKHLSIRPEYDTAREKKFGYGLKAAVEQFFPEHAGYEEDVDFHSTDPDELRELHKYNILDTAFTLRLAQKFYTELAKEPERLKAATIEAQCLPLVAWANWHGIPMDQSALTSLGESLTNEAATALVDLAPHGITEKVVRSPQQLSKVMFEDWRLPVVKQNTSKKTGKITNSTDKEVLHELAFVDPRAKQLRQYREALTNKTKFVDAPSESARYNGDGKSHPLAIVFGTYCVPGDVEVLTKDGWTRLDCWQGGDIAQVTNDLDIKFLQAHKFTGPIVDTWVSVDKPTFTCMFTHGHTVVYLKQKTNKLATTEAQNLLGPGEQRYIPTAGNVSLSGQYSANQMRLFAAVQADGYIGVDGALKFTFKKARKIARIKSLLAACGIPYREYVCGAYPDRTEFTVRRKDRPSWLGIDKKLFGPWVLDTDAAGLAAFVDELVHWDGTPHQCGGIKYTSSIEGNITWAMTAASLVGRKSSVHAVSGNMYSCHISAPSIRAVRSIRPRDVSEVYSPQRAYCATTTTGFWLARSRGQIFVTGNTGRMTYASKQGKNKATRQIGFALHQEKREGRFRDIAVPPEGYTLVEFDAAGQEYRWMAIASGDPAMQHLCMDGEDAHSYMGAQIARRDYAEMCALHKEGDKEAGQARHLGKVANLSCGYRTSANKLRTVARVNYGLPMELPEATYIRNTYMQTYANVPRYWASQIERVKRLGYAETFAGRRVQVQGNWAGPGAWSLESTAINYPIQGTGADQKYLALAVLRGYIVRRGIYFAWELHDGLYFYIPTKIVDKCIPEMRYLLNNLPYKKAWGFTPPIPLPWDCKASDKSWGQLKEVKYER